MDPALLGPRLDIAGILANPYQASLGQNFVRSAANGGRIGLNHQMDLEQVETMTLYLY